MQGFEESWREVGMDILLCVCVCAYKFSIIKNTTKNLCKTVNLDVFVYKW